MTHPSWSALTPDTASARSAAVVAMEIRVSSGPAKRRVLIPDRVWIHSSLESSTSQTSSFVTTRSGR